MLGAPLGSEPGKAPGAAGLSGKIFGGSPNGGEPSDVGPQQGGFPGSTGPTSPNSPFGFGGSENGGAPSAGLTGAPQIGRFPAQGGQGGFPGSESRPQTGIGSLPAFLNGFPSQGQGQGGQGGFPGGGQTGGQFPGSAGNTSSTGATGGQFAPPPFSPELQARLSAIPKDSNPGELKGDNKNAYLQAISQSGAVTYGADGGTQLAEGYAFQAPQVDQKQFNDFKGKVTANLNPTLDRLKQAVDAAEKAGVNVDTLKEKYDSLKTTADNIQSATSYDEASSDVFALGTLGADAPKLIADAQAAAKAKDGLTKADGVLKQWDADIARDELALGKEKDPTIKAVIEESLKNRREMRQEAGDALDQAKESVQNGDGLDAISTLKYIAETKRQGDQEKQKISEARATVRNAKQYDRAVKKDLADVSKEIARQKKAGQDTSALTEIAANLQAASVDLKSTDPAVKADAISKVVEYREQLKAYTAPKTAPTSGLEALGITTKPAVTDKGFERAVAAAREIAPVIVQQGSAGSTGGQ